MAKKERLRPCLGDVQIRNRPTVADRPHLGSPDSGLTYFL
jgi:hypothetical protein